MWIGCLGPLTALLMVFDGSKQILNFFLASLIVMSLHKAVALYCQHVFPSLSIFSNCSLILACLASGCLWIASWTRVTNGFKLKEKGFPNCPNPVCTSGNTLRTHTRVIVAGRDGNSMFGCEIIKRVVQVSVLVA